MLGVIGALPYVTPMRSERKLSESREDRAPDKRAPTKQPYAKPKVREYGDVRELTQSGTGTAQDKVGGSGSAFMTAK